MSHATLRLLPDEHREQALALAARAFVDEEFLVALLGPDRIDRLAGSLDHVRSFPWSDATIRVGAYVRDVVVGVTFSSRQGECESCLGDPEKGEAFEHAVREAHSSQPDHAWLNLVAVDPVVHRSGLGALLVADALDRLDGSGATVVLLECEPHLAGFYGAAGFVEVDRFPDAAGRPVLLMRRDSASVAGDR